MLKLKKLQIAGFKSFGDRAELVFPGSGVVGVVGPNGCGKSNLADAICWVLGEQSAKTLRGQRMEDVIFSGTRDRAGSGMAEVSLTLINPQEFDITPEAAAAEERPLIPGGADWEVESEPAGAGSDATAGSEVEESPSAGAAETAGDGVVLRVRPRRKSTPHNRRGEIVVTRRLFRSGESEYLMNGRPCRLRDIQEIFLGTGLGPDSYAIIEQGRIGQILGSKPHERRAILEEAAGVTKFKARRKLAEAKLEAARQNLARIQDIFEEVSKQLGALKRQATKARRHEELRQELEAMQRRLLAAKAARLAAEWARLSAELAARTQALEAQQQAMAAAEQARSRWVEETGRSESELRQVGEALAQLAMEMDRAERQIAFNQQQCEDLERRAERLREQAAAITAEREQQAEAARRAGEQDAALAAGAARARQALTDRRGDGEASVRAAAELEQSLEAARQQMLAAMARAAQAGTQAAQAESFIAALDRQLQRTERERQAAGEEAEAMGARRGQLGLEFDRERERLAGLAAALAALEAEAEAQRQREAATRERREQARQALAEAAARRRSLEEIVAHHGGNTEAVRTLFAQPAGSDGAGFRPLGVLADFLEVESHYEGVVEEFLREELNYVVVQTWDEADAGVGLLRRDAQGRATFLVHPEDGQYGMFAPPETSIASGAGGGEAAAAGPIPLRHCVRVLNGFGRSLEQILPKLGSGYILDDPTRARALAAENPAAYFLTGEGECFHNQTVTGGTRSGAGPLTLKREWRELAAREGELQAETAQLESALAMLTREIERTGEQRLGLGREHAALDKEVLARGQALKQLAGEAARAVERDRQLQLEWERGQAERRQAAARSEAAGQEREAAERERAEREAEQQELGRQLATARQCHEEFSQLLAAAQAEAARWEERERGAEQARAERERVLQELEQRAAQAGADADGLAERRDPLQAASAILRRQLEEQQQARTAAEERRRAAVVALEAARAAASGLEAAAQAAREALEAARQEHSETEVAVARLESEAGFLAQTCRNELRLELAELRTKEAATPAAAPELLAEWEQAAAGLKAKIENLGPVNMMALEEYQETEQRHQFLAAQRQDLLDSAADTQRAIQEIDAVCRRQFDAAWEQINAHFQETFRTLFGGGQGFLRLTDADNGGESGVDIVAQPPGKKLQNAMLLSGGEKAMTAMALVLAIFQFQPSPFCLLDEVDAPMDEANVGRFTALVRELSTRTQFIVITHNARTMEDAAVLYGVTMPKAGVSRLVSVELTEARATASA
ncbi:MAG: chromosome segregation protein SMC [Terriglobales bacterium]